MSKYRFVRSDTQTFHQVGIMPDGCLYNPNGYPDKRSVRRFALQMRDATSVEAAVPRRRRTHARGAGRSASWKPPGK
jgi:hypothetical protein